MHNTTLTSIKDCNCIFTKGEDVLILGKCLWLFRTDGSFVAKLNGIRFPLKVAFLSDRKALVDGAGDGAYHYISLEDGTVIWSCPKKGRRTAPAKRFAISTDESIVYDSYCLANRPMETMQIDLLFPQRKIQESYSVQDCLRVTEDIFCDDSGNLYALQSHLIVDPGDPNYDPETRLQQNGILELFYKEHSIQPCWKKLWKSKAMHSESMICSDGKYILYGDLSVFDIEKEATFSLLQHDSTTVPPQDSFIWSYEKERKLLTVSYIAANQNLVIDCAERRIVAKYVSDDVSVGFQGCLVGNEFWIGTKDGVIRKPFPHMDDIPACTKKQKMLPPSFYTQKNKSE